MANRRNDAYMTHARFALALCALLTACAPIGPPTDDTDDTGDETSTGEGTSTGDAEPWYPKLDVGPPAGECQAEAEPCKYSADCCGELACISLDGELAFCRA